MLKFLSWDCANRTLAHAHVTINSRIIVDCLAWVEKLIQWRRVNGKVTPANMESLQFLLSEYSIITNSFITFHSVDVKDVLEGKKVSDTDEIQRARALHDYLVNSNISIDRLDAVGPLNAAGVSTRVLIEQQPTKVKSATNNKSTHVSSQLAFYYIMKNPALVSPKLKNKLTICAGMEYAVYVGGVESEYYARKKHTKMSLLYLLKAFNREHIIAGISKSCLDDLADAVFQVFAHMIEQKLFVK